MVIPGLVAPLSSIVVEASEWHELDDIQNELDDTLDELDTILNGLGDLNETELEAALSELSELDDLLGDLSEELREGEDTPRRAIYILPGYSVTKLYSQRFRGLPIWLGPGTAADISLHLLHVNFGLGRPSELINDEQGTGMSAFINRDRDRFGALPAYIPMMISIRAALIRNGLDHIYTIEFFPYNFIGDLNDAARELADDIRENGYESVILIGHSNGGMVASTFVAQSEENRNMVESAILIGVPLWGSYLGLEMIETGAFTLFDGTLYMSLINVFYNLFLRPISRRWIMDWSVNSPNLYQMSPGPEYISRFPLLYRTEDGMRGITEMEEVYEVLNRSPNLNSNLVDGNERSLRYLREIVFDGDILDVWEGVNLTLLGNDYGRLTPITVVYRQYGDEAIFDGNVFTRAGDGIVIGESMRGDGRFDYINIPSLFGHVLIVMEPQTLRTINDLILGRPVSVSEANHDVISTSNVGMSDMIRVEIKSSDPLLSTRLNSGISVNVYNSDGVRVAEATGDTQRGFGDNGFVYSAWSNARYETNILFYIPKEGYTVEVFTGRSNTRASDITVFTQTLSQSGAILSRNGYHLTGANRSTGSIFTLNGSTSMTPSATGGVQVTAISNETFRGDWTFTSDTLYLERETTFIPEISGPDASYANLSDYEWHSSDPAVVSVTDDGLITTVGSGTAIITAIATNDSLKIEILSVTVYD